MVRSVPNSDRDSAQATTLSRQPLLPPDPQFCTSPFPCQHGCEAIARKGPAIWRGYIVCLGLPVIAGVSLARAYIRKIKAVDDANLAAVLARCGKGGWGIAIGNRDQVRATTTRTDFARRIC